jgi:hypothetical protein
MQATTVLGLPEGACALDPSLTRQTHGIIQRRHGPRCSRESKTLREAGNESANKQLSIAPRFENIKTRVAQSRIHSVLQIILWLGVFPLRFAMKHILRLGHENTLVGSSASLYRQNSVLFHVAGPEGVIRHRIFLPQKPHTL